jgi:16S rRNA (adenine1518-N6/adenine1519-N6)-dimethyltransferase
LKAYHSLTRELHALRRHIPAKACAFLTPEATRKRCIPALDDIANHYPKRLDIIEGDALETDFAGLTRGESPVRVCANLPYRIAPRFLSAGSRACPGRPGSTSSF